MANTTVKFFPIRDAVGSPDPEVEYYIYLDLTTFDKTTEIKQKESTTLSGIRSTSLYYQADSYQCECITDPDGIKGPTTEEMEMFLSSIAAGEEFTLTNLDNSADEMTCQLVSRGGRRREESSDVNRFTYSFTVREVVA